MIRLFAAVNALDCLGFSAGFTQLTHIWPPNATAEHGSLG